MMLCMDADCQVSISVDRSIVLFVYGLFVMALGLQRKYEVVHAGQRVWMLRPKRL